MSAGGRRIPEAVIERDYVLAFKGGTVLGRCWFEDYRLTICSNFSALASTASSGTISPKTIPDMAA
jgi:hypothetical protein